MNPGMVVAVIIAFVAGAAAPALAATVEVNPGNIAAAIEKASPGDTVLMADGLYAGGIEISSSGREGAPITLKAASNGAVIDGGKRDGLVVSGSWVVVEGIRFQHAGRSGIGIVAEADRPSQHVTVRNCVFADNRMWGAITSHTDHFLIENCEAFGSAVQHGIYFGNSGKDAIIRNNRIHNNNMCGLQMNGDPECGGDGIIARAMVEGNVIWENGKEGGSALNVTHVQDSTYRNNLVYNNLAGGIVTYYDTGGEKCASKRNQIYNNTILFRPGEGRWCLSLQRASSDDIVKNNIFVGGKYGVIWAAPDSLAGHTFNNNVYATYEGQALIGDTSDRPNADLAAALKAAGLEIDSTGVVSVESWRKKGFDKDSIFGQMPRFANAAGGDYHLAKGSAGEGIGADLGALVPTDMAGAPRPQGKRWDCGCYQGSAR